MSSPLSARRRRQEKQTRSRVAAVVAHPAARQTGRPNRACSGGGTSTSVLGSHPASARNSASMRAAHRAVSASTRWSAKTCSHRAAARAATRTGAALIAASR